MSAGTTSNRIVVAGIVATMFAGLVWADTTGLAGAAPAWWLLPVVIVVAIGGVDELVRLCGTRDLLMPTWLLRPAAVAIPLAAACGAQAFSAATVSMFHWEPRSVSFAWSGSARASASPVVTSRRSAETEPSSSEAERASMAASTERPAGTA
jgi:hypothetical protein